MWGTPRSIRICHPDVSIVRWWNQQSITPLSVMGRPTRFVGDDVVDLAPRRRNRAPGDEASAVAQGDRPTLVRREAPLGGTELQDGSGIVDHDRLDASRAHHVSRGSQRDGDRDAVGVGHAVARLQIAGPDAHQHGGRGTADLGVLPGARGGRHDHGDHVVTLLVGRARLGLGGHVVALLGGEEPATRAGREMRVEEAGEPGRDLGHELAADRDEPIACTTDAETAATHGPLVVGFGSVLVEVRRPRPCLDSKLVGRAPQRRALACADGLGDERPLGGVDRGRIGHDARAGQLANDDGCRIRPELA